MTHLLHNDQPLKWCAVDRALSTSTQSDRSQFVFEAIKQSELTLAAEVAIHQLNFHHRSLVVTELISDGHLKTAEKIVRALNYKILPHETTIALNILARQYPKVRPARCSPFDDDFHQRVILSEINGVFNSQTKRQLVEESVKKCDYLTLRLLLGMFGLFPARKLAEVYASTDEKRKAMIRMVVFRWMPNVFVDFITELMLTDVEDAEILKMPEGCFNRLERESYFELLCTAVYSRRFDLYRNFKQTICRDFGRNWTLHERTELFVEFLMAGEFRRAVQMSIPLEELNFTQEVDLDTAVATPGTALNALFDAFDRAFDRRHFTNHHFRELIYRFVPAAEIADITDTILVNDELKRVYIVKKLTGNFANVLLLTNNPDLYGICLTHFLLRDQEFRKFCVQLGKELTSLSNTPLPQSTETIRARNIMHDSLRALKIETGSVRNSLTTDQVKGALRSVFKRRFYVQYKSANEWARKRFVKYLNAFCVVDALNYYKTRLSSQDMGFAAMCLAEREMHKPLERFLRTHGIHNLERYEQVGLLFELIRDYPVDLKFDPEPGAMRLECFDTCLTPECCAAIEKEAAQRDHRVVIALLRASQPGARCRCV